MLGPRSGVRYGNTEEQMNATFPATAPIQAEPDRVRQYTPPEIQKQIDHEIVAHIKYYSHKPRYLITGRLEQLEREWDIERYLETNASALALTGVVLSATVSKKWLLLTATVLGFLFQHAVQGWCPPVPLLRKMGVRTRREIDREKYALKFLRGDFEEAKKPGDLAEAAS